MQFETKLQCWLVVGTVFLCIKIAIGFSIKDNLVVTTESGNLVGNVRVDRKGAKFFSFTSIPYAKSPVGDLRFMAPQPADLWKGILNATVEPPSCYQNKSSKSGSYIVLGQEDCLYLNIFTHEIPSEDFTLKPVMVFIHGGGFEEGSSRTDLMGPEFFMTEDIVLVTLNYRVGILGFLSLEDPTLGVRGNAGLKDQAMALQWVNKNIKYFGGDPTSITIFGESAGSASVEFHTLSPMSQGLFHKAIAQSGSALNPWTCGIKGTGKLVAQRLGINYTNETDLLETLKTMPVGNLNLNHDLQISSKRQNAPVVENHPDGDVFLPDEPRKLLESGKFAQIPMMIGYASNEGLLKQVFDKKLGKSSHEIDFLQYIPNDLNIEKDSNISKIIVEKIKQFYVGNKDLQFSDMQPEIDIMTDSWFWYGIYTSIRLRLAASNSPIYFYRFSADTNLNTFKKLNPITAKHPGAGHADDLGYLFKNHRTPQIKPGSQEDISIDRMIKLWTNFAKYGNPTPEEDELLQNIKWPSTSDESLTYLEIGNSLSIGSNPDQTRIQFWDEIYKLYSKTT